MIEWTPADLEAMKSVEVTLGPALKAARDRGVKPALIAVALVRQARVFLRAPSIDRADRRGLIRVFEDFLNGRTGPRDAPEERRLILPPEFTSLH